MLRIHFTAEDFADIRFAPHPAPLQEMHAALTTVVTRHGGALFAPWRGRVLRSLPATADPLADLVPAGRPPTFLDVLGDTMADGFEQIRATSPGIVRSELKRVYGTSTAPGWIRGLHGGDKAAWHMLRRAQQTAYDTVLAPVWSVVQDLHREEFSRYALAVAAHGAAAALLGLAPGSRLRNSVWEWPGPVPGRDVFLNGRGLLLLPTFHHPAGPLLQDVPGHPVVLTYPAGPGLPPTAERPTADASLAAVLGRTRLDALRLLAAPHTTTSLARALRVSNATASSHAAALRSAGLVTTARTGRSVTHRRTALGTLVAGT
ncbi:ArsR/SmtB family transcription factor [Streptomyces sp. NPDC059491]|uniref:ArsR/SmtB family transcription factor n=1 Tax=Streptomyces sp. NPDC059491 TaxID=3346850 RepID=UPI00367D9A76